MSLVQSIIYNSTMGVATQSDVVQAVSKVEGSTLSIKEVVDSYTILESDQIVVGNFIVDKTITLPNIENKIFTIKSVGVGKLTITNTVDGITNFYLNKGGAVQIIYTNSKFYIIGSAGYGI